MVKLRTVFLEFSGKPRKTSFFNNFFGPKANFLQPNMPFLLFAHLLQTNWRLYCKFERNENNSGKLWGVLAVQCLKTPKTAFLKIFGVKRNLFPYKFAFFNVVTLNRFSGQLSCCFDYHRRHTTNLRNVSVQTLKPKTKPFFDVFSYKRQFLFEKIAFFIVAAPCAINWASISWFSASSELCGENAKQTWKPQKTLF